ncbi:phthiocerol/phthiodiolone dimycocerosyl transferase [Mycobacterium riyadhense]|uniref:Phthiocerol/phthiodiolone dimycocerosyl transferase n=1 Tax=Mycobacterium riyadhense TaxID=486698 RepID=A0A653EFI0_9MYCO|nr:phthiocerol/phthiodiolone dimycocerosyl transferase [Mycobacterium riyadhense]VTO96269.1 Phthiocerol/phthiodiolone dimycocerosyl transferase [Mycobacterium riyadhense]
MFAGSVIRRLAPSEEVFAKFEAFTSMTVRLRGRVDVDAMSEALDALLEAHPVLGTHLEQGSDGSYHIVADDFLHNGMWVADGNNGMRVGEAEMPLDQSLSLVNMRLTLGEAASELTVFLHHAIADGHHGAALLDELFSRYTDVVTNGDPGPVVPQPVPYSPEAMLAQRGITKLGMSGIERFLPLLHAYDLPAAPRPTVSAKPGSPQPVPVTRVRLTEQETADLVEFGRENRVSVSTVVAGAILMTEWKLRETPHVPIPYCYPVDLRYVLNPPVNPTDSTNLVGVATYLAEIGPDTDIVDLASDIAETFRNDLSDGLIQQSGLYNTVAFQESPPGLPPLVFCTDVSALPDIRTPAGIELDDFQGQFHCAMPVPIDFYGCGVSAGQLTIERHGYSPGSEKPLEEIRSLLCTIPSEYGWVME